MPNKTILHWKANHALVLRNVEALAFRVYEFHTLFWKGGELISVSPRNSSSESSLETPREVNNNQLEAEIPRIRSFQDFPLSVKAINSYF